MNYNKRQQAQKQKTEDYYRSLVSGNGGVSAAPVNKKAPAPAVKKKQVTGKKKKKSFAARFIYAVKKTAADNKKKKATLKQQSVSKPASKYDTIEKLSDTIENYRTRPMSPKKRKRRNAFFYTLVILLFAGIAVCLSLLFFKVNAVIPNGCEKYTPEEILEVSGIEIGKSIFSVNKNDVKNSLCETLPYIKDVEVKRHFPDEIILNITETKPVAAINTLGGYALIDSESKILALSGNRSKLPEFTGVKITGDIVPGMYMQYESEDSAELISVLSEAFDERGLTESVSIVNIGKRYDISFVCNSIITCKIADISNIDTKLGMIKVVIEKNSKTMKAIIDASNPEKVFYRPVN